MDDAYVVLADQNVRAHLQQRVNIAVTIVEYALANVAGAISQSRERRYARLQVGGEAGVEVRLNVDRVKRLMARPTYANGLAINADIDAHLLQLGDDDAQVRGFHIVDGDIAAGDCRRNHDGARHQPIRHRRIFDRVKPAYTVDNQGIAA